MVAEKLPQEKSNNAILKLLADDKNSVSYRPSFARLTGSATAAILLQQIVYWWSKSGSQPFFKFKEPCEHKAYKEGDSWCEELAISRAEFDCAIKAISTRISKSNTSAAAKVYKMPRREDFLDDDLAYGFALVEAVSHIVLRWQDADRKTWYDINTELFTQIIEKLYDESDPNVSFLLYLGKVRNSRYLGKVRNSLSLITETTQETTHISFPKSATSEEKDTSPDPAPLNPTPPLKAYPDLDQPYQWIVSSAHGTLAHIARSVNGRSLCGVSLRYRVSQGSPIGPRTLCADCEAQYAKRHEPTVLRPAKNAVLKTAVAINLQEFPPGHETKATGFLANVVADFWKDELKTDDLSAEQYEKIARSVPIFVKWYRLRCPGMSLPTKVGSLGEYYTKFPKRWRPGDPVGNETVKAEDDGLGPLPFVKPGAAA